MSGRGRGSWVPCLIAAAVCVVACSVSSGVFFLAAGSLAKKVSSIAASSRGKPYKQVVAEVHAVVPDVPIYVVRQGTGQTLPSSPTALLIAVDAKGTVVDFPEEWTAYPHAGVVATFGDFS